MRFIVPLLLFCNISIAQSTLNDLFHPDSVRSIVNFLSSDSLKGRYSGSEGAGIAARFIARNFYNNGISTVSGMEGYYMNVPGYGSNVIGGIQGKEKPEEIIIFSAHYDHVGTSHTNIHKHLFNDRAETGDTIYNGANDNASGVAALLTIAKYLSTQRPLERTVLFIAFTGEEQFFVGSSYFAEGVKQGVIKAVINLEMLGRPEGKNERPYITGGLLSSFLTLINQRLYKQDATYGKRYFRNDPHASHDLFRRSDNYPFALLNIPAHSIMLTSPDDKYYHSLNDEPWTLDFEVLSKVIRAIALATEGIVRGQETPSRLHE